MTRILNESESDLIRAIAEVGDVNFDVARSLAESAGFDLLADAAELEAWCIREAEGGNARAQHALSKFLHVGLFGKQDESDSYRWCLLSAKQNYAPAMCMLAGFFTEGLAGLKVDSKRALELLTKAAEQDYSPAYRTLAVKYLTGSGVAIDSQLSFEYFELASHLGDAYSQFMLSTMMLELGEPRETAVGIEWLEKAASQELPSALRQLAAFHADGRFGFAKDESVASRYFDRADAVEAEKRL